MPRLIEPIVLRDYGIAVGGVEIEGTGLRVGTFSDNTVRHMSPAAARRLAKQLAADDEAPALGPVIEALNAVADRVEAVTHPLADMQAVGSA